MIDFISNIFLTFDLREIIKNNKFMSKLNIIVVYQCKLIIKDNVKIIIQYE